VTDAAGTVLGLLAVVAGSLGAGIAVAIVMLALERRRR